MASTCQPFNDDVFGPVVYDVDRILFLRSCSSSRFFHWPYGLASTVCTLSPCQALEIEQEDGAKQIVRHQIRQLAIYSVICLFLGYKADRTKRSTVGKSNSKTSGHYIFDAWINEEREDDWSVQQTV